jgi:Fe-S oxidoreductase
VNSRRFRIVLIIAKYNYKANTICRQDRAIVLLLGCVQRVLFPQVNAATARVLTAEGCEVVVPGRAARAPDN